MRKNITCILLIAACLSACSPADDDKGSCSSFELITPEYSAYSLEKTTNFEQKPVEVATISSLHEVSGLAASRKNKNAIWAHNDSSSPEILYLIDTNSGEIFGRYRLDLIENIDWEDMETGPGPDGNESYIYLADIGDNANSRPFVIVYRFPEPQFIEEHRHQIVSYQPKVDTLIFSYPDRPKDAEALLLDPVLLDLYIISKRESNSTVYIAEYPYQSNIHTILRPIITFPFNEVVGGDINTGGREVLIKTYGRVFYWKNEHGLPICQLLAEAPLEAPYTPEQQGEAIAFGPNGYYTLSEYSNKIQPVLYSYRYR